MTSVDVTMPLSRGRRNLLIVGVLLMAAGFTFSGYGGSIATPAKLAQIGGSDYYALNNALATMGMMLALPLVGKLCAMFGPKAVAVTGMGFQLAMRLLGMLAPTPLLFTIAMTLSSVGAGLYVSLSYTFISNLVPPPSRPMFFGFITTCNALGALAGPLTVGKLVDVGLSGTGYVIHAPLSILAAVLLCAFYPKHQKDAKGNGKFDIWGILLLVSGVCCLVLWLSLGGKNFAWVSLPSVLLLAASIAAVVVLIRVENRVQNPSVPVKLFKKKRFTAAFVCMALMTSYGTCAAGFCIFYVQQVMQLSPQISATVTMPQTIVQALCGLVIGRMLGKHFAARFRPLALAATLMTTAATFLFYMLTPNSSMLIIYAATVLGGVAMSIAQTAFTPFFQTDLEPREYAAAQGLYSFGSNGGSCIFSALAGVLLNASLPYNSIFLMAVCFNIVAFIIVLFYFKLPKVEIH